MGARKTHDAGRRDRAGRARRASRSLTLGAAALLLGGTAMFSTAPAVQAAPIAPEAWISGEVGNATVAARAATQALQNAWRTAVLANGASLETLAMSGSSTPPVTSGAGISGVIGTASNGTAVSVQRTRYTAGGSPTYIGVSTSPGIATCSTSGQRMQDESPRPTSMVGGTGCTGSGGFAYSASGGPADDLSTRDGLEFTFSAPVLAFGAWIGDLESRTDNGVPGLLRLYDADDTLLSETVIAPDESVTAQVDCGSGVLGCGNQTTRWIGFEAGAASPVARMVLIVGDNTLSGSGANAQGISFIGATVDVSSASLSLAKSHAPLTDTNGDGRIGAGDRIDYTFAVTNTGTRTASSVAIVDAGATSLSCPDTTTTPLAGTEVVSCTGQHVLTQTEVDAGSYANTATATATVASSAVGGDTVNSAPATDTVPVTASPALSLAIAASPTTYSAAGATVTFTYTFTNTGNVTLAGLGVLEAALGAGGPGASVADCADAGVLPAALAPGGTANCRTVYTAATADLGAGFLVGFDSTAFGTAPGGVAGAVRSTLVRATASYLAAGGPAGPSAPPGGSLADGGATLSPAVPALAGGFLLVAGAAVFALSRRARPPR